MKLLFGLSKVCLKDNNQNLVFSSGSAAQFEMSDTGVTLTDYGFNNLLGSVQYKGEVLFVYERIDIQEWRIEKIRKGTCWVENEKSERLILHEALICALADHAFSNYLFIDSPTYSVTTHFLDESSVSLISYDLETEQYKTIDFDFSGIVKIDQDFYASSFSGLKIRLVKFDKELNQQWLYEDKGSFPSRGRSQKPLDNGSSIIVNLIAKKKDKGSGPIDYVDGEVFCFSKTDGAIIWQRKFPMQVDDCQLLDKQRLALFTDNEIHILSPELGETMDVISTDFNVLPADTRMFVYASYLFMFNNAAKAIHIYDTTSLECIRQIDVSVYNWRLQSEPVVIDGKIYLEVLLPRLCSGLLIIDPDDIHAPLDIEEEPDFEVIEPTEENGSATIIADGIRIDDVVRFGEILVLEKMRYLGSNFWNHKPDPNFNGEVKLIYKNPPLEIDKVKEYLDMMIERTKVFAKEDGYRCGKGKTPVHLSYYC